MLTSIDMSRVVILSRVAWVCVVAGQLPSAKTFPGLFWLFFSRQNSEYTSIKDPEEYHIETPNFNQMAAHNDGTRTDPPQKCMTHLLSWWKVDVIIAAGKYPDHMKKGGPRLLHSFFHFSTSQLCCPERLWNQHQKNPPSNKITTSSTQLPPCTSTILLTLQMWTNFFDGSELFFESWFFTFVDSLSTRIHGHIIKGVQSPFDRNEEIFFEIFDERKMPIVVL